MLQVRRKLRKEARCYRRDVEDTVPYKPVCKKKKAQPYG